MSGVVEVGLEGASRWARAAAALVPAARASQHFAPTGELPRWFEAFGPGVHRGLYAGLALDRGTGMPTHAAWTRLRTDAALAAEVIAGLGDPAALAWRAASDPAGVHARQLLKLHYHRRLLELGPLQLDGIEVRVRRVDASRRTAELLVVCDKLDASGLLLRHTLLLRQRHSLWTRPMVEVEDDAAGAADELRAAVFRVAGASAAFAFLTLAGIDGIEVESVTRASIGPLIVAGIGLEHPLEGLIAAPERGGLLSLGTEIASRDVAEGSNDPLHSGGRDVELPPGAPFNLFRDRKFAVDVESADALSAFCKARGARCVIYRVRLPEREGGA